MTGLGTLYVPLFLFFASHHTQTGLFRYSGRIKRNQPAVVPTTEEVFELFVYRYKKE